MADSGTYDQATILRRQKIAEQMLAESSKPQPIRHWAQGLAQLANVGSDAFALNRLDKQAGEARKADTAALMGLLGGTTPPPAPAAPVTPAPAATPSPDMSVPRGIRNNNPLNIEAGDFTKGQPGFAGSDGRFAKFQTPEQGTDAASKLLDVYSTKHGLNTVGGIVNRWAPPSDNNPSQAYVASVAGRMGVAPDATLNMADPDIKRKIIAAMGQFENGRPIPASNQVAGPGAPSGMPPAAPQATPQPPAGPGAVAAAMTPQAAPQSAPESPGGLLASVPANQRAAVVAGLSADPSSPARALATSILSAGIKGVEKTNDIKEYELAQRQGFKGSLLDYQEKLKTAGKPETTINNTVNPILKGVGDRFNEGMDSARGAIPQIQSIHEARRALDQGAITGLGSDAKLFGSKAASLFGLGGEAASNTEVLRSSIGNSVLAKAKTLGANPSNADRDYIEKVVGGSIKLEESSIRRLLDMQEKWARDSIHRANDEGKKLLTSQPKELANISGLLNVEEPEDYASFLKKNPISAAPAAAPTVAGRVRKYDPATGKFD